MNETQVVEQKITDRSANPSAVDPSSELVTAGGIRASWFAPLAPIYNWITSTRNRLYDSGILIDYPAPLPVICVGNATVGGSGKSPVAAAIATELKAGGRNPVILSRGYGGSVPGPRIVTADDHPDEVGDEPVMHRRFLNPDVPVVISRDRVIGAGFIAERKLGDVIVLDDGYQHRRLRRNLNLLLIDISSESAVTEWKEGRHLPAGRFRESREQALSRANALILVSRSAENLAERTREISQTLPAAAGKLPIIGVEIYSQKVIDIVSGQEADLSRLRGGPGIAACGLARPEHFFSAIKGIGIEVVRTKAFADHHPFSPGDLKDLLKDNLPLFVTAKDAVKLLPFIRPADQVFVLVQGLRYPTPGDHEKLVHIIGRI